MTETIKIANKSSFQAQTRLSRGSFVFVLAQSFMLTAFRRFPLILIFFLGALSLLTLQFVTFYALGDELIISREIGLSNIQVGGILICIFALSRAREGIEGNDRFTVDNWLALKPISALTLISGQWLGLLGILLLVFMLWGTCLVFGLEVQKTSLSWDSEKLGLAQELVLLGPALGLLYLQAMIFAGIGFFIQALSNHRAGFLTLSSGLFLSFILGTLLPHFAEKEGAGWMMSFGALILPDFRLYSPLYTLYPEELTGRWIFGALVQSLAYSIVILWAAAIIRNLRE